MLGTALAVVITLLVLWWRRSQPGNPPPSPGLALPVLGHLHLFKGNNADQIQHWRKRLGNVFTVQIGPSRTVFVSGYKTISEVFVDNLENTLYRSDSFLHETLFQKSGIFCLGGDKWKEQKAFLSSALRSLGFGRNAMAERIRSEAEYLTKSLEQTEGEPTDMSQIVSIAVTNVIAEVTFGRRFDASDPEILSWIDNVNRLCQLLGSSALINIFPVLRYIPGDAFNLKSLESTITAMKETLTRWIGKQNRLINTSDQSFQDLTQAYLTRIEQDKQKGRLSKSIDDKNLLSSALQLFNGGMETTKITILLAVIYLINFPEIQERVFQEIKENIGTDRLIDMSDKTKTKYLSAFIMETQRYSSVITLSVDRLVTCDFKLGGYTITKGTTIIANNDSLMLDVDVWGDPENFRPDRFLSDDGRSLVIKKEFLPFGIGKRNCIGESLAAMELYLIIGAIVQQFQLKPEANGQLPSMALNSDGLTRTFQPFKVRVISRKS